MRFFLLFFFSCVPAKTIPYQPSSTQNTQTLNCAGAQIILPEIEFVELNESDVLNTSMTFKSKIFQCGETPKIRSLAWTVYNKSNISLTSDIDFFNYMKKGFSLIYKDYENKTQLGNKNFFDNIYPLGSSPEITLTGINSKAKENDNDTHHEEFFLELSVLLEDNTRLYTRAYIHIDLNFNPIEQAIKIWTAPKFIEFTPQFTLNFSCSENLSYVQGYNIETDQYPKCQGLTKNNTSDNYTTDNAWPTKIDSLILPMQNKETTSYLRLLESDHPIVLTKFFFSL